jgi:hypothetical protein
MADIFVSYSQADKERVLPIVEALKEIGWSVWWDAEGAAGAVLDEMVDREIKASKCVVVVWSKTSVLSDWVLGEADEARERRHLVPVVIDDVQPPRRFRQFNTVRLESWDGDQGTSDFHKLVAGVQAHVAVHPSEVTQTVEERQQPDVKAGSPERIGDRKGPSFKKRIWLVSGGVTIFLLTVAFFFVWQPSGPGSEQRPDHYATDKPGSTGATIRGRIVFDGEPITRYSTAPANITLYNSETRENLRVSVDYDSNTSTYGIRSVPPGKYNVSVRIESGHPFDQESGGDFYSRLSAYNDPIEIPPNSTSITRDLKVLAVVHVRDPEDNQDSTRSTNDPPKTFHIPSLTVRFRWDEVPKASRYELHFITEDANGRRIDYKTQNVTGTTYSHRVPDKPDYQHSFRISAYAASGNMVGNYVYYYTNGSGGWLEYRVRAR